MGKTESGAIWLDKELFSVFDYWQFWRNTDDRDVLKFLKMFTDLKLSEIEEINNQDINQQKIILANEATKMLHGVEDAKKAESIAKNTFSDDSSGKNLPDIKINKSYIDKDIINLISIIKKDLSKSEIRRLIRGNAVKLNNEIIRDEKLIIDINFFSENYLKLSIGKKRHLKIELD